MVRTWMLFVLGAAGVMAQFGGDYLPSGLVDYLEISDAQRRQIVQLNAGFERFRGVKMERSSQVQVEIDRETREPNPDAMALGLRYREIEAIRREIDAEQTRTVEAIQAVLTAGQKLKLAALQEVLRMQSTACAAVDYHLMPPPPQVFDFTSFTIPANRVTPVYSGLLLSNGTCSGTSRILGGLPVVTRP